MATIYKIKGGDESYIGSTKRKPIYRFNNHKYDHKKGHKMCTSFTLFEKYGDQCTLEILEECTIEQRYLRERFHIENTVNTVNKHLPVVTKQEIDAKRLMLHECKCGGTYSTAHKARHFLSKFHVSHS